MQHKVKLTVIDKKLYPELQAQYCADPNAGTCFCYNIGDTFVFENYDGVKDFLHMGLNTLKQTTYPADGVAGGSAFPHCSEAWDAISRYIYTGLQGGSIMRRWMNDDRVMIACCSDGTRPVIFKIERLDYYALHITGMACDGCRGRVKSTLTALDSVTGVEFRDNFTEVFVDVTKPVTEDTLKAAVENCGNYTVTKID